MAKHVVKCAICGESFDTQTTQAVKHGARRYAHATCEPNNVDFVPLKEMSPEELERKELTDYIDKLFGDSANWAMISKQIKNFHEDNGYSYNSILKSLMYFYEVKKNPISKANGGIAIVPYCYNDAKDYFLAIYLAQNINNTVNLKETVKEFVISIPKIVGRKKRTLNWELDDEE